MKRITFNISLIIRIFLGAVSFGLLAWVNMNFFTVGTVIGSALFGGAFLLCVFWKPFCRFVGFLWKNTAGKIILGFFGAVIALCSAACVFFTANMISSFEKSLQSPSAVIVLGCQVRGETPSTMLARRLDAAAEVLNENPQAICVVSGGQGRGEDITEAEAMRRYLLDCGISEERIILEDKSTNTRENISNSAELLRERDIKNAVIVTSEFHQYRAMLYAKKCGLEVGSHSAYTPTHNLLNYWVREWAALFKQLVER